MKPTYFDWGLSAEHPCVVRVHEYRKGYMLRSLDLDFHRSIHLNIVIQGDLEGEIDGTHYSLEEGEAFLTAPWEPHRAAGSHLGGLVCMIAISLDDLLKVLLDKGERLTSVLMLAPDMRLGLLRKKGLMRLAGKCGKSILEYGTDDTLRSWQAIINFFMELVSAIKEEDIPDMPQSDYIRLRPALQLIHSGHGKMIAVSEAAAVCDLGVSRFRAIFRKVFRRPFASYELQYRLNAAADDLREGRLTVKNAASEWGFFDSSHFSRLFKAKFGVSPGKYRRKDPGSPGRLLKS